MDTGTTSTPAADKSPDQIEREMLDTRDSIAEKVALLETKVMGNVNSLSDTATSVKDAVTDTVQSVRDAVVGAPAAVADSVKQTFASVGDSVKEAVGSFDLRRTVRTYPWAAVGTSAAAGFALGLALGGRRSRSIMAQGHDEPVSGGRVGTVRAAYQGNGSARADRPAEPGLFGRLFGMVVEQVRPLVEDALSTATASIKQSIKTQVPQAVDTAVHGLTDRVAAAASGVVGGSAGATGTTRVGGPNYTATPPAGL